MAKSFEELRRLATQIRDEKGVARNTAARLGQAMLDNIDKLQQEYPPKTELDKTNESVTTLESKVDSNKTQTDTKLSELSNDYNSYVFSIEGKIRFSLQGNTPIFSSKKYRLRLQKNDIIFVSVQNAVKATLYLSKSREGEPERNIYNISSALTEVKVDDDYEYISFFVDEVDVRGDIVNFGVSKESLSSDIIDDISRTYSGLSDCEVIQCDAGNYAPSTSGNRIRIIRRISSGCRIDVRCQLGKGAGVGVYNTRLDAVIAGSNLTEGYDGGNYHTERIAYDNKKDGWLSISLCKTDDSAFSPSDVQQYLSGTILDITSCDYIQSRKITDLEHNYSELYLFPLVQGGYMQDFSIVGKDTRVCTRDSFCPPYAGCVLRFHLPWNIMAGIALGNTAMRVDEESAWLFDGNSYSVKNSTQMRIVFAKHHATEPLSVADVEKYINDGDIRIAYERVSDIITDNAESTKYVQAAKYLYRTTTLGSSTVMPTFAHLTDIHGDVVRYHRALEYCKRIGVDAVILTGDYVAFSTKNDCSFIAEGQRLYDIPVIACTGNHDTHGFGVGSINKGMYDMFLKDIFSQKGFVLPSASEYEGAPTYFYYDIPGKLIRIIALNEYDNNNIDWSHNYFTVKQMNWFARVLKETPAGYGIILIYHQCDGGIKKIEGKDAFYQSEHYGSYDPLRFMLVGVEGNPIVKMIDAFIAGASATISWVQNGVSASVNVDFTHKNSGVEFIAHLNGHEHMDYIGAYSTATQKQLVCNGPTTQALYGPSAEYVTTEFSDMARGGDTSCQDCFNIYTVDRNYQQLRITRVGANISSDMRDRKHMNVNYIYLT